MQHYLNKFPAELAEIFLNSSRSWNCRQGQLSRRSPQSAWARSTGPRRSARQLVLGNLSPTTPLLSSAGCVGMPIHKTSSRESSVTRACRPDPGCRTAASFDVVFCDHGGLSWAPPHLAVPEAARVLRRPGRLVFSVTSPWFTACYDDDADQVTTRLRHDYFGLGAITEEHGAATYQLTYGGWIRTLRGAGLTIDDLIEPRPNPGMRSGYTETDPPNWACRWPAEMLWIARKP